MRYPKFKSLSVVEVRKLWLRLKEMEEREKRLYEQTLTDDKLGVRLMHRDDNDRAFWRMHTLSDARYALVEAAVEEK